MNVEWALQGIAGGDEVAFSWLYANEQPLLLRYATGILAGDRAAAEDAVDEAFIAVWHQAGRFAGRGSARAWLRGIVRNKVVDYLRRRSGTPLASEAQTIRFDLVADEADGPDQLAEKKSAAFELRAAMERLSLDHREVIWLCYFEELPLSEIALQIGCPENTVKTRLFHARKAMRATLEPRA
jgi:RNA polymerase sigma-70 factor (ECF subfamily)